jgi:UDP-N-acetylglucosamine acyltransferase
VVVEGSTEIGARNEIHGPSPCWAAPPQHTGLQGRGHPAHHRRRNIIREHVTMHTGTVGGGGVTKVGSDGLYMVGSHVAHDCIVGDRVILRQTGATLGGHVVIGDYVFMGGLAAVHQFTRIGRYCVRRRRRRS